MRTRAYRPEVAGCLEERLLLSGVTGPLAHPVILSRDRLNFVAEQILMDFDTFARNHDIIQLRNDLGDVIVIIPFGQVDGLERSINRILHRMQHELSADVPHAFRSARHDVLAVTRAEVVARIRAGDVIVR
jgi:hypothetical protein